MFRRCGGRAHSAEEYLNGGSSRHRLIAARNARRVDSAVKAMQAEGRDHEARERYADLVGRQA